MSDEEPRPVGRPKGALIEITTSAQRRKRAILKAQEERGYLVGKEKVPGARSIARRLVENPRYQRELLKRLVAGVAGPIEVWLWRYAWGDPEKNEQEQERMRERYEQMRTQLLEFLKAAPERAAQLDAAVQGAKRLLPLPKLPEAVEAQVIDEVIEEGGGLKLPDYLRAGGDDGS